MIPDASGAYFGRTLSDIRSSVWLKKKKNPGWLKLKESMNIAVSPVHSLFVKTLNECFSSIVSLRVLGERRRLWDHFRDHVRSPGPRLLQNSKDSYQIV